MTNERYQELYYPIRPATNAVTAPSVPRVPTVRYRFDREQDCWWIDLPIDQVVQVWQSLQRCVHPSFQRWLVNFK